MAEILTSYAQNFEDVILWRALRHVRQGYYVDIGACDPVMDSVNLAFYERGWRGLNVEPEPLAAARLREARPGDEVLQVAIAETAGAIGFHAIPDTGLSTCDAGMAKRHADRGYPTTETTVPCLPLCRVLDGAQGREVHWLKIDVEGSESAVIGSWAPSPVRPWIVVVEVVSPYGVGASSLDWEPALLGLGYTFVYFDGLNRFYLSAAHPELRGHFGPGPNIFDGFVLSGRASAPFCGMLLAGNRAARQAAADLVGAAEQAAADRVRIAEQQAATRCGDLRSAITVLATNSAATSKTLAWCRRELRAARRKLWRQDVARRDSESEHEELLRQRDVAHASATALEARVHALWQVADTARRELAALHGSSSWRLTAPLRWATQAVRVRLAQAAHGARRLGACSRWIGALVVATGLRLVRGRPRVKRALIVATGLVPGLHGRLARFVHAPTPVAERASMLRAHGPTCGGAMSLDADTLPASARRAYRQLVAARAAHAAS